MGKKPSTHREHTVQGPKENLHVVIQAEAHQKGDAEKTVRQRGLDEQRGCVGVRTGRAAVELLAHAPREEEDPRADQTCRDHVQADGGRIVAYAGLL